VRSIVAVRDEDIDQAIPSRLNPDIVRKLHEYCRLIIRIRETLTAMTQGQCGNFGWHHIRTFHLPPLAYVKVLTVRAVMEDYAVSNIVMIWDTLETVYRLESVGRSDRLDIDPRTLIRHHRLCDVLNNEGLHFFWMTEQVPP